LPLLSMADIRVSLFHSNPWRTRTVIALSLPVKDAV
jgi:hypothetical protein